MYISPIITTNRVANYRKNSVKNITAPQENPTFKRAEYAKAFTKYFEGPVARNEEIFKELMSKAQNIKGVHVESLCEEYFRPEDYRRIIEGSRECKSIYDKINTECYKKPAFLVKDGDSILVSVFNMGYQGDFLDLLFSNLHNDIRICFHDINNYKNIICLGRDNDGFDKCVITRHGLKTLIASGCFK